MRIEAKLAELGLQLPPPVQVPPGVRLPVEIEAAVEIGGQAVNWKEPTT